MGHTGARFRAMRTGQKGLSVGLWLLQAEQGELAELRSVQELQGVCGSCRVCVGAAGCVWELQGVCGSCRVCVCARKGSCGDVQGCREELGWVMTSSASYPVYPVFCYSEDGGELLEALQQRSETSRLKTTSMPRVDNRQSGTRLGRSAGADTGHFCAVCLPGR